MDLQPVLKSLKGSGNLSGLFLYILGTLFPSAMPLLSRNPRLLRIFGSSLVLWSIMLGLSRLKGLWDIASSYLISAVNISESDDLYDYVTEWVAEAKAMRLDQTVNASLLGQSRRGRSGGSRHSAVSHIDENVKFGPDFGMQVFFFRRRLFCLLRSVNTLKRSTVRMMHLCCFSRSTQPQKDLLEEIYLKHRKAEQVFTIIRRPGPAHWFSNVVRKSVRPMDTVILEEDQKRDILSDIEEYLEPETRDMYISRGIPYRRGYVSLPVLCRAKCMTRSILTIWAVKALFGASRDGKDIVRLDILFSAG
jgi:hypothetical protein